MALTIVGFVLFLQIFEATPHTTRYDGYQVLTVYPRSTEGESEVLQVIERYGLDLWRRDGTDKSLDVLVSPELLQYVNRELQMVDAQYYTWIQDVQPLIDEQIGGSKKSIDPAQIFFSKYHTFEEITSFVLNLTTSKFYGPSGDQIFFDHSVLARTYEDNPIHMLKIHKPGQNKLSVFVEGGIHAREWISPAVVLYIINELLVNPSSSVETEELVDAYDWYFVPVLNPDGYTFAHTTDRLWRKNRRPFEYEKRGQKRICYGVDLNRNFKFHWNPYYGGSPYFCSDVYSGPNYFSEVETQAIRNFLEASGVQFISYLSFHSYGQYWIYPWGYTPLLPEEYLDLNTGAEVSVEALRQRYNTSYIFGSTYNLLYPVSGAAIDYTKGSLGIKYSYTCELRDRSYYGFLLPEEQIIPTCQETMDAVVALMGYIKRTR